MTLESIPDGDEDRKEQDTTPTKDFGTEDAFCDDLSDGTGPQEVEILGMELLLDEASLCESDSDSEWESDADSDGYYGRSRHDDFEVDSLVLTRRRLPHLVIRRPADSLKYLQHPAGEVDSLILTRRKLPHRIHKARDPEKLAKYFQEGKGLMGEVSSVVLTKRRLPHLARNRKNSPERPTKNATSISNGDDDVRSTASTESVSSFDSGFSHKTVDSLVLARRRFAKNRRPGMLNNEVTVTQNHTNQSERRRRPDRKLPGTRRNTICLDGVHGSLEAPNTGGVTRAA